jgi:hypothetical protein
VAGCAAVSVLLGASRVGAAPCSKATDACVEGIAVGGERGRVLVYRTHPLDTRDAMVTRGLIVIHGASRDAHNYFRHALAAAYLAEALNDTIVVSVHFASNDGDACGDALAADELNWRCDGPARWTSGGGSIVDGKVTSFDVVDEILARLARAEAFPNLRTLIVSGHSAGGQFVARYAMSNEAHDRLRVPVGYVISNPSSYAYLDGVRPTVAALSRNRAAAAPGYVAAGPGNTPPPFAAYNAAENCTAYDSWPYGMKDRVGYSAGQTVERLTKQLVGRPTTYLLGGLDILPLFGFDASCAAMAQGPTRLARGLAFARYANERLGAAHKTVVVASCGHDARCMFTADAALPLLFPKD